MVQLTTSDHSRDIAGYKYIYPVMSRRAGGLSIGINLNTNNACNWRCVYCQVPDLVRGNAPDLDFSLLKQELTFFIDDVKNGNFYERFEVPEQHQVIKDIAISGNGEPTSLEGFDEAISLIGETIVKSGIKETHQFVLITNGSLIHKSQVKKGLALLRKFQGQVWFKLDSATQSGRRTINNAGISGGKYFENLLLSAQLCPTWIQTCVFAINKQSFDVKERDSYLQFLAEAQQKVHLEGVLLYTLARPSMQPEAKQLEKMTEPQLAEFAEEISKIGLQVRVSA